MKRLLAAEAIFSTMRALGLNDEDKEFEDMLRLCTDIAVEGMDWNEDVMIAAMERAGEENWCLTFMTWKFWTAEAEAESLLDLLLVLVGEGRRAIEDGVHSGKTVGAGAGFADATESAGYEDLSGDGAPGGRCAESEAGTTETEFLGNRTEDEETAADWLAGAASVGLAQEYGEKVGVPREGPGEASDEAGRVERRKTCFGSLPPMSEHRTTLYAKGVCR